MTDLPEKSTAFFDWYNEVVERNHITDKRYPVKGLNVWPPFGHKTISLLDGLIRREVEGIGYEEVSFPTLVPETEFKKEGDHIKGFESQVYWVTHGGTTPLDVRLCLRPTSETAMYPMFALWVRSHRDLPLRIFQIVSVFRYETKTTRPLIRVREIHFFEGHTVHLGEDEATRQVQEDRGTFERIAAALALPYLCIRRPDWDKFPGAHYSLALDTPFGEGRTLQVGTIHHYRDNFAVPFGISYEEEGGARKNGHQTTYGLSERLVGAVIGVHGDAKGLVFPVAMAPVQVVVVPIPPKEGREAVEAYARELGATLTASGFRVKVDASDDRPGAKYYLWESRGVPLRLEVGRREAQERTVTTADRLGTKGQGPAQDLKAVVQAALDRYQAALAERARAQFHAAVGPVTSLEKLPQGPAIRLIGWCGGEACGHAIERAVDGALLGTVEGGTALPAGLPPVPPCIGCQKPSPGWAAASQPL